MFFFVGTDFCLQLVVLLFIDYTMTFATLKGEKQCFPFKFLFQNNVDIITYLTMDHHKSSKMRKN